MTRGLAIFATPTDAREPFTSRTAGFSIAKPYHSHHDTPLAEQVMMSQRLTQRIMLPIFAIGLALGCDLLENHLWRPYTSTVGKYRVSFPGKPKLKDYPANPAKGQPERHAAVVNVGRVYRVDSYGTRTHWEELEEIHRLFNATGDASINTLKGTLRSRRNLQLDGYPAQRFVFDHPSESVPEGFTTSACLVLDGRRMYFLQAVGSRSDAPSPEAERFLTSFHPVPE